MLNDLIRQSEAEESANGLRQLTYVADGVGMLTSVGELGAEAAHLARISGNWLGAGIAIGTVGVLAQYVGFWLQLGGAHADAMAEIAKDHVLRGMSYGAVLGANGASPKYAHENFWLWAKPVLPFYPEFAERAQKLQNAALVTGYNEGKKLSGEDQRAFFTDLRSRMDGADYEYYDFHSTPWKEWSAEKKKEFYITAAAIFRRDHLE